MQIRTFSKLTRFNQCRMYIIGYQDRSKYNGIYGLSKRFTTVDEAVHFIDTYQGPLVKENFMVYPESNSWMFCFIGDLTELEDWLINGQSKLKITVPKLAYSKLIAE